MAKEKQLVILSVRVDDALAAAIKDLAEADDRPLSNYIERLLRKHAVEQGKELGKAEKAKPAKTRK